MARVSSATVTADDIREKILMAARTVCGRWGIDRTRMDDIAREAGVSRPNLYNYFANKDQLMIALVRQTAETINSHFEATLPIRGSSKRLFLERLVGGVQIGLSDELTRDMHEAHKYPETWEPVGRWWSAALAHARKRGELRPGVTDEDALRWIRFLQYGVLEHPDRFTDEADIRRLFERFAIPSLLKV
jgi:AcrR family transcriptional regulator